jgi:hypothetical protein
MDVYDRADIAGHKAHRRKVVRQDDAVVFLFVSFMFAPVPC